MADVPSIYIHKFWTEYKPDASKANGLREVDWVAYSPIGSVQKTMLTEAISRLSCVLPLTGKGADNPTIQMAHARWNIIKPQYEAWKQGREAPIDGIPLAAWNGVTTEQAQVFRMKGVRTVDEVSKLTDTHMQNMGIPGLLNIRENAKRFLEAQDKNVVTDALAKKDAEIAELRAQMAELVELVKEQKAAVAAEPEPKRKAGWPKGKPRKPPEAQSEAA